MEMINIRGDRMVRKADVNDAKQIAMVVVDTWRTAYKGIVNDEYLDGLRYEERENVFKERILQLDTEKFLYVFEDAQTKKVVGFIWLGKPLEDMQYDGEIYALYVLYDYQKHGIGRQLIKEAIYKLKYEGCKDIVIWALKDNIAARKFYERMGGKLASEKKKDIGGQILDEVAYIMDIL